ncbi:MAG: DEAD/DEAH box helicase, partial [Methanobacteriota archaeon]
ARIWHTFIYGLYKGMKIVVTYMNDTFVSIDCEAHIAMELDDYFTFKVPGYRFMPAYKNKIWDGTIHLFNLRKGTLYYGLIPRLIDFCNQNGYHPVIDEKIKQNANDGVSAYDIEELVSKLKLSSNLKPIKPRDYQLNGTYIALKKKRALLLSPTSSGKSLIIYMTIRGILERIEPERKVLIVVPTTGLVSQMYDDFMDYSHYDHDFNIETMCHKIMAGSNKTFIKQRIVISTWQSIYKMPRQWFDQFSALIIDEAHLAKANSIKKIAENMIDCPYKIGLTGTLDGTKTHQLVLEGLTGSVHQIVKTKELMNKKQVAELTIKAILLQYPDDERKEVVKWKYQDQVEYTEKHRKRNAFLAALAISQRKNCLMLFNKREHGKMLYDLIRNKVGNERPVYYITGEMSGDKRNELRHAIEDHENAIVLASYGVFSTGVNIKNLHSVIFCSSVKSKIRTLQSIGRGLRMGKNKESVVLYDIVDDLSWKKR